MLCIVPDDEKKATQERIAAKRAILLAETKICSGCQVRRKLDCYDTTHKTCSICRTPKVKPVKEGTKCSKCVIYKPDEAFKQMKNGLSKCCILCLEKKKSKK
jgi:hypothetical protein